MNAAREVLKHLAIIMDGNGRWAQERSLTRIQGHTKGYEAFKRCVDHVIDYGIPEVTFYAMSSENFSRPALEVQHLMQLFLMAVDDGLLKIDEKKIVIKIVGDTSRLSYVVRQAIDRIHQRVIIDPVIQLNICFSYGGQWHITSAFEKSHATGNIDTFHKFLMEPFVHPIDFVIRTGGDQRMSNFALWQLAYAELMFIDAYWPDFDKEMLDECIKNFLARKRRFGQVI